MRTRRPDTPDGQANSTVSEGIAYGMLIAVMCDDQALFDGFWTYARCFLNKSGLMDWYIAPDGARVLAPGAASDADVGDGPAAGGAGSAPRGEISTAGGLLSPTSSRRLW